MARKVIAQKPETLKRTPQEEEAIQKAVKNQLLKEKAQRLFTSSKDTRKRYDWEWLTRDLFRRGYQFSRYNPSNRTVILSTRAQARVPINLVAAQMRVVRNQVTSFRPKWEVLPRSTSEEAQDNARYSGKLLDYYYDKLGLRKMLKETVTQGLMYSVGGPWQVGYDPDANEGRGCVYIWLIDTYDFFLDPNATSVEDAEFACKAVRRPLDAVKNNPNYEYTDEIASGESTLAASEYKQFLLQALKNRQYSTQVEEEGVILKEMWMKERVNDKNVDEIAKELAENDQDNKDLRKGEVVMRVVTFIDTVQNPLRVQLLRRDYYPFELYQADINPLEVYGESWIKHVIPPNRVLNALESSIFEYHYKFAKGRLAIQKNSGVRIVSNEHGDIVEYNAGALPPTAIPISPLPASYQNQIANMRGYIEDIGGAHDASLGRVPSNVKSGIGIAELKSADATNSQDLVDNLEDFLVRVANKLLREIAENYDIPTVIEALGKGGNPEHFAVIGEANKGQRKNSKEVHIGGDVFNLAVIGKSNEVRVSIGSWLAYTKEERQKKLQEYFQAGLIDQQTFLENAEFGDVQGIIERSREDALLEKLRGQPAQPGMPSDEEIAEQENIQMTQEGKFPQAEPQDNHQIHIIIHQKELGVNGNPIVEAHIQQHVEFLKKGVHEAATRQAPVQSEMALMPAQQPQTPPPAPQQPVAPSAQYSPDEQAIMASLSELTGGQNATQ